MKRRNTPRPDANGLAADRQRARLGRMTDASGPATVDPLFPADDAIAGFILDATVKGIPPRARLRLDSIGRQGWNVLAGDLPFPIAVLDAERLRRNAAWMQRFCALNGLSLCPHGKTTMAPQIFALQQAHGAWGITVATAQQLAVARRFGVRRALWANQPVGRVAVDAAFDAVADPGFDLFVLADSLAVVEGLAAGAARAGLDRPLKVLLEIGNQGGRTGARDAASALAVARAVAAAPGLVLAGVECFEGLLADTASVDAMLDSLSEVAAAAAAEGLIATEEMIVSAGGSAFFDRAGARLPDQAAVGRPVRRVLRSGCYITQDDLGYTDAYARIRAERSLRFPEGDLLPALSVWTMVQSVPEPRLAILTGGKRDIGFDLGQPVPRKHFRPGLHAAPVAFGAFHRVSGMNDQHTYLVGPTEGLLEVGDLVGLGIGHPCATFDRWQVIPLVDEALTVTGAVRTFF
jgi:D-serine dehydratase